MSHKNSFQQKSSCLKVTNASIVKAHECKVCKIKINNIGKLLCSLVLIYYEHEQIEGRDATVVYIYRALRNEGIKRNRER